MKWMQLLTLILGILLGVGVSYVLDNGSDADAPAPTAMDLAKAINSNELASEEKENLLAGIETNEQFKSRIDELVAQGEHALSYEIAELFVGWLSRDSRNALLHLARLSDHAENLKYESIIEKCGTVHRDIIWTFWVENAEQLGSAFAEGVARIFESQAPMKAYEARFLAAQLPDHSRKLFQRVFADSRRAEDMLAIGLGESDLTEKAENVLLQAIGYTFGIQASLTMEGLSPVIREQLLKGGLEKVRLKGERFFAEVNQLDNESSEYLNAGVEMLWAMGYETLEAKLNEIEDKELQARVIRLAFRQSIDQDRQAYPIELWERHVALTGQPPMLREDLEMLTPEGQDLLFPILATVWPEKIDRYQAESFIETIPRSMANELAGSWKTGELGMGAMAAFHDGPVEEFVSMLPPDVPGESYAQAAAIVDSARSDPEKALELAKEIDDPSSLGYAIVGIAPYAIGTMPEKLAGVIDTLPNGSEKDYAKEYFAHYAAMLNPREGSRILADMHEKSPLPDAAIQTFVRETAEFDIRGALEWLDTIHDSQLRTETFRDLQRRGLVVEEE